MKLLIDTHAALWWINEFEKVSPKARAALLDSRHERYISIASAWEIALKASNGRLTGLNGGAGAFFAKLECLPISIRPITRQHLVMVEALPFIHRDPFDRLLVAVAKSDGMTILTADANIQKYGVPFLW